MSIKWIYTDLRMGPLSVIGLSTRLGSTVTSSEWQSNLRNMTLGGDRVHRSDLTYRNVGEPSG